MREVKLDLGRAHSRVHPPHEGATFEQGGYYFNSAGELVEALLTPELREALEKEPEETTPEAPAIPADALTSFKAMAAAYRTLSETHQAQFRALAHLVPMEEGSLIRMENEQLKRECAKLAQALEAERTEARPTGPIVPPAIVEAPTPAPDPSEPVEKADTPAPKLDLVGWLRGTEKYQTLQVSNEVKRLYGFTGGKAAIVRYLVEEKALVAAGEVKI